MPSTIQLQNTLNWASPIIFNKPLASGTGLEPAVTNANIIKQTMMSPPFCWRWNRATSTFTCNIAQSNPQDYAQAIADFGFMETAAVFSTDTPVTDIKQLEIRNHSERTAEKARPTFISSELDDGAGNITFRLAVSPDKNYPVTVTYQKKPIAFLSLAQTWGPIPDELGYIFNNGFLALAMLHVRDERYQAANQKFISGLLGAAQGLTELQQNLFLANWLAITGQLQTAQLKTQQSNAARST